MEETGGEQSSLGAWTGAESWQGSILAINMKVKLKSEMPGTEITVADDSYSFYFFKLCFAWRLPG